MSRLLGLTKLYLLTFVFLFSSASWAASVGAIRNKKVLINLDGDNTLEGEEYYLVDPNTRKKTGIIRIQKIRGEKALADLLKGGGQVGFSLQAKAPTPISTNINDSGEPLLGRVDVGYLQSLKNSFGVLGSYSMNSMTADITFKDALQVTQKTSASMTGSGFGVGGFYEYAFWDSFSARAFVGLEQFNVAGTASANGCAGTTSCKADITYLSGYGLLKWYPVNGKFRFWVGGGSGLLFALSKSSSALNEGQISTNQVFTGALGADIQLDRHVYVPVSIEYNSFPSSSTVSANMIVLRAGWAWNL